MKTKDKIKEFNNKIPVTLLKSCLTLLILAIFLVLFFTLNCNYIFYKTKYVSAFTGNEFQIHTIDVGQGDCFLIRLPGDKTMLLDCGDSYASEKVVSYINQYLSHEKLSKIDYFVLTHPDFDHIGGGKAIVNNFIIKNIYRPKYYSEYEKDKGLNTLAYNISDSSTYNYIIKTAYQKEINMFFSEKDLTISGDGFNVKFLSPKEDSYSNSNDYSAVLMISCQGQKALFMGDASAEIESTLISDYNDDLHADILKIAHHGSKSSTTGEFLEKVNPAYAIISVDMNNSYGLPSLSVLNRLNERGIKTISTASVGNFAISVKNDEIKIRSENKNNIDVALLFSATIIFSLVVWALPIKIEQNNAKKV